MVLTVSDPPSSMTETTSPRRSANACQAVAMLRSMSNSALSIQCLLVPNLTPASRWRWARWAQGCSQAVTTVMVRIEAIVVMKTVSRATTTPRLYRTE